MVSHRHPRHVRTAIGLVVQGNRLSDPRVRSNECEIRIAYMLTYGRSTEFRQQSLKAPRLLLRSGGYICNLRNVAAPRVDESRLSPLGRPCEDSSITIMQ